jgi:hypothetical protein
MNFDALNGVVSAVFSEPVIWLAAPDRTLTGIFDSRHFEVTTPEGDVGRSELVTTLAIIADPDDPVKTGETLIARDKTYRVKDMRPDGQGMTVLELELS